MRLAGWFYFRSILLLRENWFSTGSLNLSLSRSSSFSIFSLFSLPLQKRGEERGGERERLRERGREGGRVVATPLWSQDQVEKSLMQKLQHLSLVVLKY